MRKNINKKMMFLPLPVLIIGTYDEEGNANFMNAAWGGISDYNEVYVSLSEHKTTKNFNYTKAVTISFATKDTKDISDYFGIVSGNNVDKVKATGINVSKSNFVNAPIPECYPLTLECTVKSFNDGILLCNVVNISVDENYLLEDGTLDIDKMELISFDMASNTYRVLGEVVGKAFSDGERFK